jgi:NADP-dependent 3-hydroxy acid dehydrogenase YdfG
MSQKHAVIVGAGPGIGLGAARAFGGEGFAVSLLARRQDHLERATRSLTAAGITADGFVADAGDAESLSVSLEAAITKWGVADTLIYNAVSFSQGRPTTVDPAILTHDFAVNVAGALTATRTVLPGMRQRGTGTLLFTGGGWAIYPDPAFTSMGIGKGALRTFVTLLAQELKGSGIRVGTLTVMGTVQPGSAFDPDAIGRAYLDLYHKPIEGFPVEVQYRGNT